jgi:hypothetical protein
MATRVNTTTKEAIAVPIFQTVASKGGDLLITEGTFAIFFQEKGMIEPVIIFEGTYKGGQGYYDGKILTGYGLYLYPNGYFGVKSGLNLDSTVAIGLQPASMKAFQIRQQQLQYIESKIGKDVIDQPKDGINAAV